MSSQHAMAMEIQKQLKEMPGNLSCVDCGAPQPSWASVSYGTLFCLECSGRHRSLGVHISFVRSVTMDSWNERQIRAMLAGGNAKLTDHFRKYGVDKLPIVQKYHTAAAAMYRDILVANRDGKAPPTDIKPYEEELEAEARSRSGGSSTPSVSGSVGSTPNPAAGGAGGGERPGESPVERELRLRAEAQERLRQKFGQGGLKAQSVNNNGFGSISSSGSAGAGASGGSLDEFLGVDISGGTAKLAGLAGNVLGRVAEVAKTTTVKVAEGASVVTKKVQDGHIGDKLASTVTSVTAAVTDPALLNNVQKGATSLWGKAASVGTSFWSQATATVKSVAVDLGVPPSSLGAGGAGGGGGSGGAGSAGGSGAGGRRGFQSFNDDDAPPPVGQHQDEDDDDGHAQPDNYNSFTSAKAPAGSGSSNRSSGSSGAGARPAPARNELDDEAWLAQQVAGVSIKKPSPTNNNSSAAGGDLSSAWEIDNWESAPADNAPSTNKAPRPVAAVTDEFEAATGGGGGSGSGMTSVSLSNTGAAAGGSGGAKPADDDDDFFASFGVK